jgi:hypothetical protein
MSPRFAGRDPYTGRSVYVSAQPGGALERLADETAVEAGVVLCALVSEILAGGQADDAELSALVSPLYESLASVTEVAARSLDRIDVEEPAFGSAARALGDVLRASQQQG